MSEEYRPYNPLDKKNLGKSIQDALLDMDHINLPPTRSFIGAGLYAIYYKGNHPLYRNLGDYNKSNFVGFPIYVGKAIPEGGRIGGMSEETYAGHTLYRRLNDHADSIKQAQDLNLEDFYCRFLVLDDIWIPLGENLMIEAFSPVWNHPIDGFGNHDPGGRRATQRRSIWDSIHLGRPWSEKLADQDQIKIDHALEKLRIILNKLDPKLL